MITTINFTKQMLIDLIVVLSEEIRVDEILQDDDFDFKEEIERYKKLRDMFKVILKTNF